MQLAEHAMSKDGRPRSPRPTTTMSAEYAPIPTVGTQIAPHLTLRSVLGEGGMATVFEAYHARLQASVAVKIASVDGASAPAAAQRLVREARICARLDDPHFPRVYDIATLDDGRPYYVMELVSGPSLERHIEGRAMPPSFALKVTHELLVALREAHAYGIVHRDVKPQNVILQLTGGTPSTLRLIDFGIAHLTAAARERESNAGPLTMQGALVGTPGYMAPEQIRGGHVDFRTDLFATGMVLHEMLLGRHPIDAPDTHGWLHATLSGNWPDIRTQLPDCDEGIADWIARATAIEPDHRFGTLDDAIRELLRLEQACWDEPASGIKKVGAPLQPQAPAPRIEAPAPKPQQAPVPPSLTLTDDDLELSGLRPRRRGGLLGMLTVALLAAAVSAGVTLAFSRGALLSPPAPEPSPVATQAAPVAPPAATQPPQAPAATPEAAQAAVPDVVTPAPSGPTEQAGTGAPEEPETTQATSDAPRRRAARSARPPRSAPVSPSPAPAAPQGELMSDYMKRFERVLAPPPPPEPAPPEEIPDNPY